MQSSTEHAEDSAVLMPLQPNRPPSDETGKTERWPTFFQTGARRPPLIIALPALLSALLTGVLASVLVAWPLSRRVFYNKLELSNSSIFSSAILVDENPQSGSVFATASAIIGMGESGTTLYVLLISSIAIHVVSFSTPFVLGTFGYWLADMWARDQQRGNIRSLPTPLQYGLIVGLCSQAGIANIISTSKYLFRRRESRPSAPSVLFSAFFGVTGFILINLMLTISDIWLHGAASTVPYTTASPMSEVNLPMLSYKINTTKCTGPLADCELFLEGLPPGQPSPMLVVLNSSDVDRVMQVEDISLLIPVSLPHNVNALTFNTFGVRTHCSPARNCTSTSTANNPLLPICPFDPPVNLSTTFAMQPPVEGELAMEMVISQYNLGSRAMPWLRWSGGVEVNTTGIYDVNNGALVTFLTPILAGGQWAAHEVSVAPMSTIISETTSRSHSDGLYNVSISSSSSGPPAFSIQEILVAECTIDVLDVQLSYSAFGGKSTIFFSSPPTPSDANTTSTLLYALNPPYQRSITGYLPSVLQDNGPDDSDYPDFGWKPDTLLDALPGNLSTAVIGIASGLLERDRAISGESTTQMTVSRYPLAPLLTTAILLVVYALFALAVSFAPFLLPSSNVVATSNERGETALELIHRRLFDPMILVTTLFAVQYPNDAVTSVEGSADVRLVDTPETMRIGFGHRTHAEKNDEDDDKSSLLRHRGRIVVLDAVQNLE